MIGQRVSGEPTAVSDRTCRDCPAGRYQKDLNPSFRKQCPAGKYQPNEGQTGCKNCEAGKFQDEKMSTGRWTVVPLYIFFPGLDFASQAPHKLLAFLTFSCDLQCRGVVAALETKQKRVQAVFELRLRAKMD